MKQHQPSAVLHQQQVPEKIECEMGPDRFREAEKFFRKLQSVEDLRRLSHGGSSLSYVILDPPLLAPLESPSDDASAGTDPARCGPPSNVRIYPIPDAEGGAHGGAFLIRGCISPAESAEWMTAALTRYCEPPFPTNLSPHFAEDARTDLWRRAAATYASSGKTKHRIHNPQMRPLLEKLRWSTYGYRYDWSARSYLLDCPRDPVPDGLQAICCRVLGCLARDPAFLPRGNSDSSLLDFRAESGIVNYYCSNDTLCGHQDDAEKTFEKPLISVSLGNAAVLLVGSPTSRETQPVAVLVQSGDAIVMTGAARLAYHGVPRVFPNSMPAYLLDREFVAAATAAAAATATTSIAESAALISFWRDMRINFNARQVFPSHRPSEHPTDR